MMEWVATQYNDLQDRYEKHKYIINPDLEYENAQNLYSDCLSIADQITSYELDDYSVYLILINKITSDLQTTYNL